MTVFHDFFLGDTVFKVIDRAMARTRTREAKSAHMRPPLRLIVLWFPIGATSISFILKCQKWKPTICCPAPLSANLSFYFTFLLFFFCWDEMSASEILMQISDKFQKNFSQSKNSNKFQLPVCVCVWVCGIFFSRFYLFIISYFLFFF